MFHPDTKCSIVHNLEVDPPVSTAHIDQFPFFNEGMAQVRVARLGLIPDPVLSRSAVRFSLPYDMGTVGRLPHVTVVGDGIGAFQIYAEGIDRGRLMSPHDLLRLFSRGRFDTLYGPSLLNRNAVPDPLKFFTTEISPFLHRGNYPIYGVREYVLRLGPGAEQVKVVADVKEDRGTETLSIAYIPDPRDGKPIPITTLSREGVSWRSSEVTGTSLTR